MKLRLTQSCAFASGLLICGASFAQMGPMRAPMVPQAIEMHMEQRRTLEQREAIEAKAAAAEPASVKPAPKKRTAKKAKKAQIQPAA
jgi:hypothetical protein